jgi:hypothetical protein
MAIRPDSGNGRFSGPQPHHQPQRPRNNFDEVQPQSNANASPFATARNASGQPHRGFGAHNAPRHRSGPRAQAAGFGSGQKGPGGFVHRHARRPDKPRGEVNGNVASAKETPPPSDDED